MIRLTALIALLCTSSLASAKEAPSATLYVGSQLSGLHLVTLDRDTGALSTSGVAAEVPKPTWTVKHPKAPILYVANNQGEAGKSEGDVRAFAITPTTGALTSIGSPVRGGGAGTTHVSFDPRSSTIFAANFGSGSLATIAVAPDGTPDRLVSVIASTGSGPHRRQASPHTHSSLIAPSGRYVLAPDLGADRIFIYALDTANHALIPDDRARSRHVPLPAGTGPRHAAFHPNGRLVFVVGELDSTLHALSWNAREGRLSPLRATKIDKADFTGSPSSSELAISRDVRFLYVANRGDSTLVTYRITPRTGELTLIQRIASGGDYPWHFAFDPSGRWLVAANQRSNMLASFRVDAKTGLLTDSAERLSIASPVSVTFTD